MFAILYSSAMDPLYKVILAFPTAIFTFLLLVCFVYWFFAVLGMVDINIFDVDVSVDVDADTGIDVVSAPGAFAGVLIKFGLASIPFVISFTAVVMFGWLISCAATYYAQILFPPGVLLIVASIVNALVSLVGGALVSTIVLAPLKPVFKAMSRSDEKDISGYVAIVRSAEANEKVGEATCEDGGAGLILKIRTYDGQVFKRGDRVKVVDHDSESNIYRVVSEQEFNS